MPRPETAAQMPMALARSLGSVKMLVSTDSVDGMISAPPMPIAARAAISSPEDPDHAAESDATPKIASPENSAVADRSGHRGCPR